MSAFAITTTPEVSPHFKHNARHQRSGRLQLGRRQAVLRPRDLDAAMAVDLWEAAANNRGLAVKVFRDRDQALAWLLAD